MTAAPLVYANDAIVEASFALLFREDLDVKAVADANLSIKGYGDLELAKDGIVLTSKDGKQRIRLTKKLYLFTRAAPYGRWSSFIFEARRVWAEIDAVISKDMTVNFNVVALRYINEIEVPNNEPFADYFNAYISRPDGLPHLWTTFSWSIMADVPSTSWKLALAQRSGVGLGVFLDIDLRSVVVSSSDVWDLADEGRLLKNRFFNALVTSKVKDRLKEGSHESEA